MKNKVLKMVNCWHKDAASLCQQHKNGTNRNSWWYMHGDLEGKSSPESPYDKAITLNLDEFPEYTKRTLSWSEIRNDVSKEPIAKFFNDMYINGIIDVEVHGVDEPCVGFFWVSQERTCVNIDKDGHKQEYQVWDQRGLVCLKSDVKSCIEARVEYSKRAKFL